MNNQNQITKDEDILRWNIFTQDFVVPIQPWNQIFGFCVSLDFTVHISMQLVF